MCLDLNKGYGFYLVAVYFLYVWVCCNNPGWYPSFHTCTKGRRDPIRCMPLDFHKSSTSLGCRRSCRPRKLLPSYNTHLERGQPSVLVQTHTCAEKAWHNDKYISLYIPPVLPGLQLWHTPCGFLTSLICLLLLMRTRVLLKAKLTPFKGISWVLVIPFWEINISMFFPLNPFVLLCVRAWGGI